MSRLDQRWADEVCRLCDQVFEAADVGFVRQVQYAGPGNRRVDAMLWEADPEQFAARYPDSGVAESYGQQWRDVSCIDYWVHVDHHKRRCRLRVEGWNLPELTVHATGEGPLDGAAIASTFARILAVRSPRL